MKDGWFLLVLGFVLGAIAIHFSLPQQVEIPFPSGSEASSPSDRIAESQILLSEEYVMLNVKNAHIASYANTNSMDPVLDAEANGIEVVPTSPDQIEVGDIVVYQHKIGLIPHRVIEKGVDDEGVYFIMKGDNNPVPDPDKVRFSQVRFVVIGVLY